MPFRSFRWWSIFVWTRSWKGSSLSCSTASLTETEPRLTAASSLVMLSSVIVHHKSAFHDCDLFPIQAHRIKPDASIETLMLFHVPECRVHHMLLFRFSNRRKRVSKSVRVSL